MINFEFSLDNPWFFAKSNSQQRDFVIKSGKVSTHKFWEIQITKWPPETLLTFKLDLRWWGHDHAGPRIHLEICGFMASAMIYDHRHWDWDNNCWALSQEETV